LTLVPDVLETIRANEPLEALARIARTRTELEAEAQIQVRRARHAGCSWEAIAAALGVSRQAVHKKYAGRRSGPFGRRKG
jgi:hypothetical protein